MTSVLATVSLSFSAAHHWCRHFFSPLRFMFCFRERMSSSIPFFLLFALSLSLSLYVLDDDVFSSACSCSLLFWDIVPFPVLEYIRVSAVSLTLCRQGSVHPSSGRAHIWCRDPGVSVCISFLPPPDVSLCLPTTTNVLLPNFLSQFFISNLTHPAHRHLPWLNKILRYLRSLTSPYSLSDEA